MHFRTKIFLCIITASGMLAGCSSRPELTQVSSSAEYKPINTPESERALRSKYEK